MMDADGSTDGGEILRFVGALVTGADFAKGSRFTSGGDSDDITFSRHLGNKILSGLRTASLVHATPIRAMAITLSRQNTCPSST
jgi:hypothetical protein